MKMIRRKKKRILKLSFSILGLYLLWSGFLFLRYPSLKPSQAAPNPREIIGIYHVHSTFSDGTKAPEEIAQVASHQDLDFVILTDHGRPNFDSLASEGWQQGILLLAGSELSVNRGHLVGMGFNTPAQPFSQKAELAAAQIAQAQGFTVIAHPYSKVHWTWGEYAGYSGIEIISTDAILRKNFIRLLPILPLIPLKPRIPVLKLLQHPSKNLRKWNELCREFPLYGYYSCDAHLWYSPLFSSLRLHVLLDDALPKDFKEARKAVYAALKQGRFYNAVDAAAPPQGFRFWGQGQDGSIDMGSTTFQSPLLLQIQAPPALACEVRLLQDGQVIHRTSEERISFEVTQTGTYRVEVYLREVTPMTRDCPWILSNPIFLRKD